MSLRPTPENAKSFYKRRNEMGKATRAPRYGGPQRLTSTQTAAATVAGNVAATGDDAGDYPTYPDYYYPDQQEEDERIYWKAALSDGTARGALNIPNLGEAKLEERDISYFRSKREQEELARFKVFCEQSLPRGTPWAKEYFEKIVPGWYQSKKEIIDEKIEIVKRFMNIVLNGVQSIDDMELIYNLHQGYIKLPTDFNTLMKGENGVQAFDENEFFTQGLFAPGRYTDATARIAAANRETMANYKIPGLNLAAKTGGVDPVSHRVGFSGPGVFGGGFSTGTVPGDAKATSAGGIGAFVLPSSA